jgi:hypothetical protein
MIYHRHCYWGETSCDCSHSHCYKGKTTCAPDCKPHIHYIICCTTTECGHKHYFKIPTSVAKECHCGGHYHCITGTVCEACGHTHEICDVTTCYVNPCDCD